MKPLEIQVRHIYTDGKRERTVIDFHTMACVLGSKYVGYEAITATAEPFYADCLLSTFARWVKQEVK